MIWPKNKGAEHKRQSLPEDNAERVRLRGKRALTLDWQMSLDDDAWQAAVEGATIFAGDIQRGSGPTRMQSLGVVAALLIALIGGGVYFWKMGEAGAQRIEAELRAAVEADQWLNPANNVDPAVMAAGVSPVAIEQITFNQKVVGVEVKSSQTDAQGQPYIVRQHQFYRPTEAGWERVPPDANLLGPRQTLTRGWLTFHYYAIDAEAVETVADKLNAAYDDLLQDYRVPVASHSVVIELVAAGSHNSAGCFWRHRLCIDSPALTLLPSYVLESEALYLWSLRALADHARWKTLQEYPPKIVWQLTSAGVSAMQLRRHSERLDAWHSDLTRWLYGIEGRTPPPEAGQLVQELADLCTAHQVKDYSLLFAGDTGTHLCNQRPAWELTQLPHIQPPRHLDALHIPDVDLTGAAPTWLGELAFGTLLDYVTATYGQEGIARLIKGFRLYDSWSNLVAAVFGVSAAEFEHGWQVYLQALE